MGSKSSPPPPADYPGAALAQGTANLQGARTSAQLSNPNIYGPYGSQTVNFGNYDENAYRQARSAWDQAGFSPDTLASRGPLPTPEMFGYKDQPTVTQTLAPAQQQLLDRQNTLKMGLADLGNSSIGTVQNMLGRPFDGSQYQMQTDFNAPGVPNNYQGTVQNVAAPNLQTGLDLSGVAKMPVNAGMTGQNAIMARLQPQQERRRSMAETRLVNQGLRPGHEAYNADADALGRQENDELNQAALYGLNLDLAANQQGFGQALAQGQFGNQAMGQQFGMGMANANLANAARLQDYQAGLAGQQQQYQQGLASAQFGNTARQQALQQALYQRELPLNEITALMSGSQVATPQFQPYRGVDVAPAPVMAGAQGQNQYNQGLYNANVGQQNAMMGGLTTLGAAGIGAYGATSAASAAAPYLAYGAMFSDRRLKSNIVRVGTHPLGIGIYEYDIFGRHEVGVMADEVLSVKPEAVSQNNGYLMVNYGML